MKSWQNSPPTKKTPKKKQRKRERERREKNLFPAVTSVQSAWLTSAADGTCQDSTTSNSSRKDFLEQKNQKVSGPWSCFYPFFPLPQPPNPLPGVTSDSSPAGGSRGHKQYQQKTRGSANPSPTRPSRCCRPARCW